MAARENAVGGQSVHQLSDLVKKITLEGQDRGVTGVCADVEGSLYGGLAKGNPGLKNRGVKKAPFVVLIGANMPSILAEISFVTKRQGCGAAAGAGVPAAGGGEPVHTGVAKYEAGLAGTKLPTLGVVVSRQRHAKGRRCLPLSAGGSLIRMGLFRSFGWLGWAFAAASAGCTLAQNTPGGGSPSMTLIEPPAPLLRNQFGASPQISGTSGSAAQLSAESLDAKTCGLSAVASGTASAEDGGRCLAVLKEDGITRFATAVYHHASSPAAFQAFALEFGDATGAFSAYTFYRSLMHAPKVRGPEARLGKGSSETSVDAEGTIAWAGTAVLKVTGQVSSTELTTLVAALPKNGGRRGLPPLLPTLLPGPAVEAGSIRYAIGPAGYQAMGGALPSAILGWDKSAEVLTADFSGKPGKGTLTLLLYPTPQIAGDRGRAIEKAVNDLGPAKFGTVKLLRVGPLLGVTSGAWTPEAGRRLCWPACTSTRR